MASDSVLGVPPLYVIDTSALIDLRLHYRLRSFPRLWQRFADLVAQGRLVAPEEVSHELGRYDDELRRWAVGLPGMFQAPNAQAMVYLARVVASCPGIVHLSERYNADPWVVALALELNERESAQPQTALFPRQCHVICHEERQKKPNALPKIPDSCDSFGLKCLLLRQVIAQEDWQDVG